jgi:hypothetical protein
LYEPLEEFTCIALITQTERILYLCRSDQYRDTVGESNHHRTRNIFHRVAEARDAEQHQYHARHHRHHKQTRESMLGDNACDDHDKCTRRTRDLRPRTTEQSHDESADNCGIEAGLRRDTRCNTEGHGKRQRNETNSGAGSGVAEQILTRIPSQRSDEFRRQAESIYHA